MNLWDPTKKYIGRWQIIVLWYELPARGIDPLIVVEHKFYTEQEMEEYMRPLVDDGTIYDILGTIESTWTEEEYGEL